MMTMKTFPTLLVCCCSLTFMVGAVAPQQRGVRGENSSPQEQRALKKYKKTKTDEQSASGSIENGVVATKKDKRRSAFTPNNHKLNFFFLRPNNAIPSSSNSGSVYLYQGPLFYENATEIPGATVSGSCTKTQAQKESSGGEIILGGGLCRFTFILSHESVFNEPTPLISINADRKSVV